MKKPFGSRMPADLGTAFLVLGLLLLPATAGAQGIAEGAAPDAAADTAPAAEAPAPEVRMGTLLIRAEIPEAEVFVNGERVGRTPVEVTVPLGEHRIEVRGDGLRGERVVSLRSSRREVSVPFGSLAYPIGIGVDGALGFRGDSALTHYGLSLSYHLLQQELGVVIDRFSIQGDPNDLQFRGWMARFEYTWVPWRNRAGNVFVEPLKPRARLNVARSTELSVSLPGGTRAEDTIAALGAGLALGAEVRGDHFGIEPSLYYDVYFQRSLTVGPTQLRPPLDNGGLNLRAKVYF